jgi:hypothetical protein
MGSPWDKFYTFVQLRMDFVSVINPTLSAYNLINEARNDAFLGSLTLTADERDFLTNHLAPVGDQVEYQGYVAALMTNPSAYSANGRKLNTYSVKEQLDHINASWDANRLITPDP